jgi:DNA adenine methylase
MKKKQVLELEMNQKMRIRVPPIKCQGIKTKIVPEILKNLKWNKKGKWIEPFLGSGVVLFNVRPKRAIANDTNIHIISFYKELQTKKINSDIVKNHLEKEGKKLKLLGGEYYYEVRERFNKNPNSLDFIFLNRSSFNGVMRFNSKGLFNVPFGHKPERFRQGYITKIINQIKNLEISDKWIFNSKDWRQVLKEATKNDFVYLDPPYIGRHTDYFNGWTDEDAKEMAKLCKQLPCPFMVSMWKENKYRKNTYLETDWDGFKMITIKHFYHVGSKEDLRNSMDEVLILGNFP